ncbi:MAG: calcium/sodium antiporter [Candidatus Cryptobacteroides sp.]
MSKFAYYLKTNNGMTISILILIAGLLLVVFGADILVDGSSTIARKAGLSEFLIGLTIVGIGTSLPELVVSMNGALQGNADIAIGNVMGSNLFNVLLILGLTAIIRPVGISRDNLRKDIPLNIIASLLLIAFGMHKSLLGIGQSDTVSMAEGLVFLLLFAAYMYYSFKHGKADPDSPEETKEKDKSILAAILMVLGGIAGLIFGGRIFVNAACDIARMAGLSDKFIAVTILAGGTSMPELVTCIVAAVKKKDQLALGNILGSNISNILLILGCSAVFFRQTPGGPDGLAFAGMSNMDILVFFISGLVLWASAYTGKGKTRRIDRADGIVFVAIESAYLFWLISHLN